MIKNGVCASDVCILLLCNTYEFDILIHKEHTEGKTSAIAIIATVIHFHSLFRALLVISISLPSSKKDACENDNYLPKKRINTNNICCLTNFKFNQTTRGIINHQPELVMVM